MSTVSNMYTQCLGCAAGTVSPEPPTSSNTIDRNPDTSEKCFPCGAGTYNPSKFEFVCRNCDHAQWAPNMSSVRKCLANIGLRGLFTEELLLIKLARKNSASVFERMYENYTFLYFWSFFHGQNAFFWISLRTWLLLRKTMRNIAQLRNIAQSTVMLRNLTQILRNFAPCFEYDNFCFSFWIMTNTSLWVFNIVTSTYLTILSCFGLNSSGIAVHHEKTV